MHETETTRRLFFLRMKESKYYPEDKRDIQGNCPELPYTLFVDKTFTENLQIKGTSLFCFTRQEVTADG